MPVDTLRKRTSAYSFNSYWAMPPILPDGSLEQADRQHALWNYGGILAPVPVAAAPAAPAVWAGPYKPVPQVFIAWVSISMPLLHLRVSTVLGHKRQKADVSIAISPLILFRAPVREMAVARVVLHWGGLNAPVGPVKLMERARIRFGLGELLVEAHEKLLCDAERMRRLFDDETVLMGMVLGGR